MKSELFDVIGVCGQTGLYADRRLPAVDGAYVYDFRHGDDEYFCTIEEYVFVNHAGSVILREPLDFGEYGFIPLNEDSSPNFTGKRMTIKEFLKRR